LIDKCVILPASQSRRPRTRWQARMWDNFPGAKKQLRCDCAPGKSEEGVPCTLFVHPALLGRRCAAVSRHRRSAPAIRRCSKHPPKSWQIRRGMLGPAPPAWSRCHMLGRHMLGRECPEAVLPDRALYLSNFSHLPIVNKPLSLSYPPPLSTLLYFPFSWALS
jgi:hypothetical protein